MWCLSRYLPLLIGDLVPEDDNDWLNFLHLLDIVDYILAPVCSEEVVAYLEHLIETFLLEFKASYPHCSITPRMHYLVCYPQLILR